MWSMISTCIGVADGCSFSPSCSGRAVKMDGGWRIRLMQQTWSDETLRRMIPILHAAQPVDPEEY